MKGYPSYYYKKDLEIEVSAIGEVVPVTLTAMVYIMTEGIQLSAPYPGYYRTLEEGYRRFNFPIEILEQALTDSIDKDGDESYEICD